jgi:hypothetical protein
MADHLTIDSRVHHLVLSGIVRDGYAPTAAEVAQQLGAEEGAVTASLARLHDNHGLVLHPGSSEVWIAHPFSLSPTAVWVQAGSRGFWAPCIWCAMGIATLVGGEATVHARLGGEERAIEIRVRAGRVEGEGLLVHFPLPPRDAWANVVHFCAGVLPFLSEADVRGWCERHRLPRGEVVPAEQVLALAARWYGRHLDPDWVKWSVREAQAIFEEVGLTGPFWRLGDVDGRF